jgi:hypothetical protein
MPTRGSLNANRGRWVSVRLKVFPTFSALARLGCTSISATEGYRLMSSNELMSDMLSFISELQRAFWWSSAH